MIIRVKIPEKYLEIEIPRLKICPNILHVDSDPKRTPNADTVDATGGFEVAHMQSSSYLSTFG